MVKQTIVPIKKGSQKKFDEQQSPAAQTPEKSALRKKQKSKMSSIKSATDESSEKSSIKIHEKLYI